MGPSAHHAQGDAVIPADATGTPRLATELQVLVDAARTGDQVALDDLVRATYGGTYTLAYRLTGNEDDARDVVQDAYLRAWRGLRRFRGDAQFTTWLYRITANCSANLLAKRARHRTETLAEDAPLIDVRPEIDPELQMAATDERAQIGAALAQLQPRLRQVMVLRDIYDLPHSEIAEELGITEAAAKVRLHRARKRLRDILAADGQLAAGRGAAKASEAVDTSGRSGANSRAGLGAGHAGAGPDRSVVGYPGADPRRSAAEDEGEDEMDTARADAV